MKALGKVAIGLACVAIGWLAFATAIVLVVPVRGVFTREVLRSVRDVQWKIEWEVEVAR